MPIPHTVEILKLICDNLVSERSTLASLARTCTWFQEPALDVLWSELDGFYPLTKCLPTDKETDKNHVTWIKLSRPLMREDCLRFLYYSRKVRQFTIGLGGSLKVYESVYQGIHAATLGEKIMPNIRHLSWDWRSVPSYALVPMFLGPRLSTIELTISPTSNGDLSLISGLCQYCSSLTNVKILFSAGVASIERKQLAKELISNIDFTRWTNLSNLFLPIINHLGLIKLSRLPCLTDLYISDLELDGSETCSPENPAGGGFPKLVTLELSHCCNVADCIAILKLMDCSPLKCIQAQFRGKETSESWRRLFSAINQHCDHAKLNQLECSDAAFLDNYETRIITRRSDMLTRDVLEPLLVFRNFKWNEIEAYYGFYFEDPDMIKEMASSWKNIEELRLCMRPFTRTSSDGVSKITPSDLVPLAIHCPRLNWLALPLDATSPPKIAVGHPMSGNFPRTKLVKLSVGDSPISKPSLVGTNLSAIFPSLRHLVTLENEKQFLNHGWEDDSASIERVKMWKKAEKMMKLATRTRIQERHRSRANGADDSTLPSAYKEYGTESSDDMDE